MEGRHKWHPNASNNQPPFSHLGVPAPAGMDDCYESTSRVTFRDRRLNLASRASVPILVLANRESPPVFADRKM